MIDMASKAMASSRNLLSLGSRQSFTAFIGLAGLLALAYVIVHQWGSQLNCKFSVRKKKHGSLAKSIFRYGLDNFRHAMRSLEQSQRRVADILNLIFTNFSFVR